MAIKFLQQQDAYFQSLLIELFDAFLKMKSSSRNAVEDGQVLKITGEFAQAFFIMSVTEQQTELCLPQLVNFLQLFFRDTDLVEKCQNDLSPTENSQDTEPDSDDEMSQLQSEAESIRSVVIELLHTVFKTLSPKSEDKDETEQLENLALISLPLVLKEICQTNVKSVLHCFKILIKVTSCLSRELTSKLVNHKAMLRMIDSHMQLGSIQ